MSGGEILIYGKFLLTFGGLIVFGAWQLLDLRRLRRERERRRPPASRPDRPPRT